MLGIILGILFFMVLVILHELGHFWAAKKSGVKVKEFGIGIPPKICKLWTDKSGTEYTLNRIPLGGFVSLKGEDGTNESESADSFPNAKLYKKLIIIVAGVVMNLITAFVIFTTIFMIGIKPMSILPDNVNGLKPQSFLTPSVAFLKEEGLLSGEVKDGAIIIETIAEGSMAEQIGLTSGTILKELNGTPLTSLTLPSRLEKRRGTQNNTLLVEQGNEEKILTFDCGEPCILGITYQSYGDLELLPIKFSFPQAMLAALKEIKGERNMTISALGNIGKKLISLDGKSSKDALSQLTGPVGAIKFGEKVLDIYGWTIFFGFGAMLSLALAFFNILPIPALDGGRFWFAIFQSLFGISNEKFNKIEGGVNAVFFWALMLLGVVIILKDLIVFWGVNIPFVS